MLSYEELKKHDIFVNNRRDTSYGIYVGRGSVFGNPFVVGKDGTREEVIEKYRHWFWDKLKEDEIVSKEFFRLYELWRAHGNIALLCYCFPLACHSQVIGSALVWLRDSSKAEMPSQ